MCRSGLAALSVVSVLLSAVACKDDPAPTQIDVSIYAKVAHLDRAHLKVRTQHIVDGKYVFAELDISGKDIADRDLTVKPSLLRLKETSELKDVPFLLYVEGFVDGNTTPVAAGSITLLYTKNTTQAKTIMLDGTFYANDKDHDGFPACGNYPVVTDPDQIGVLDPTLACDCNDLLATINPFTDEVCNDGIDNNCTGYPLDENCEDCTGPQDCSPLTGNQSGLAGIGQCKFGTQQCVDTIVDGQTRKRLGPCVDYGTPARDEVDGNLVDDDCDGKVDESSECDPDPAKDGPSRACFRGHVVPKEIQDILHGVCMAGTQSCIKDPANKSTTGYIWDNEPCKGEIRPQRPPVSNEEQRTVCPELWSGPGFQEVKVPGLGSDCNPDLPENICANNYNKCKALEQCDGLDNDCDGFVDEEKPFDIDGDGYTTCGSIVDPIPDPLPDPPPDPRHHTQTGTEHRFIDCNDDDSNVNPGEKEDLCTNEIDDDCRCDSGANVGLPSVDGCPGGDVNLVCSTAGGYQSGVEQGDCDQTTPVGPYYAGYFVGADGQMYCFPCRSRYGVSCDPSTQTCGTIAADCTVCADTVHNVSGKDANHANAQARPFCGAKDDSACKGATGARWAVAGPRAIGETPETPYDNRDDCGAVDCGGYYSAIDAYPGTGNCFMRGTMPADKVFCSGNAACDFTTHANCCQTADNVCSSAPQSGTFNATTRTTCHELTGCTVENRSPLALVNVGDGLDPYHECPGVSCTTYFNGYTGSSPYQTCTVRSNVADDSRQCFGGNCISQDTVCGTSPVINDPVRTTCRYPSGGCTGRTAPTYANVPANIDPYNDCNGNSGSDVCDGAGGCKVAPKANGTACSGAGECSSNACVDGVCCNTGACTGSCQVCDGSVSGSTRGQCATRPSGSNSECSACNACNGSSTTCSPQDKVADGNLCSGNANTFCCNGNCVSGGEYGGSCGSGDCSSNWTCDVNAAKCNSAGGPCGSCNLDQTLNGQCTNTGTCNNANPADCAACRHCNDTGTAASCDTGAFYGLGNDNDLPNQCLASNTQICDGAGNCKGSKGAGVGCGNDNECMSGFCTDGVCCGSDTCGACQTCAGSTPGTCSNIDAAVDTDSCNGANQYCCGGSCVTTSSGLNGSCGSNDCVSTWACGGTSARCGSQGTTCGTCSGDSTTNGTCDNSGACAGTTTECDACNTCSDGGATATCVPYTYNSGTGAQVTDTTGSNTCSGNSECGYVTATQGQCLRSNTDQACTNNNQCASNVCSNNKCRGLTGHVCGGSMNCTPTNCNTGTNKCN